MRKELISLSIITVMAATPCISLGAGNYEIQTAPAAQYNTNQTQYPLPVNSYQPQGYNYNNYNNLQGNVVMVPVNTSFAATAMTKNGQLQVKFTNIVTPMGQMIPISASIQTDDGTGILKAGTAKDVTKDYVKDVGVGAAAGAALGTAMGALSSGSVGKGAIYGTALGGGIGLGKSLLNKGDNVEIPQNAQLNIVLDQPVTVSSNTPY